MGAYGLSGLIGLALALVVSSTVAAQTGPGDYQGAWLVQGGDCAEIYSSSGKSTTFRKPVDLFAAAFILSGNRLRTPQASCRIKSMRPNGDRKLLLLDCANAVSGNDVRVQMGAAPDGTLRRYFNDQDTTGTAYQRCSR